MDTAAQERVIRRREFGGKWWCAKPPDWLTRRFIALKEMRETLFWLRLYRDANSSSRTDILKLIDESNQLVAILTTIVKRAREKKALPGSVDSR